MHLKWEGITTDKAGPQFSLLAAPNFQLPKSWCSTAFLLAEWRPLQASGESKSHTKKIQMTTKMLVCHTTRMTANIKYLHWHITIRFYCNCNLLRHNRAIFSYEKLSLTRNKRQRVLSKWKSSCILSNPGWCPRLHPELAEGRTLIYSRWGLVTVFNCWQELGARGVSHVLNRKQNEQKKWWHLA